ncbi:hypothetical protein FOA52_005104 [Chlamydomonas sp. UWO 241]|nr:hypothetical protein FOA52_005104 [Chlamydomonas sp. UWO 241]
MQRGCSAIPGLHSNWVGDSILAMARPWQSYVAQFGLVDAFVRSRIGMILNLQEIGEHEHCGPGNLPSSGFSYYPDTFMAAGIGFYNFGWRDMGVPDLDKMMDIVQVMDYVVSVERRRVAVHCHAGLGRTGLALACYLVFVGSHHAADAIAHVRRHRPGALQTRQQCEFVTIFEQFLRHLRCVFPDVVREGAAAAASQAAPSQASAPSQGAGQEPGQPHAWRPPQELEKERTKAARSLDKGRTRAQKRAVRSTVGQIDALPPPTSVRAAEGMQHETYASGLSITRPVGTPESSSKAAHVATGSATHAQGSEGTPDKHATRVELAALVNASPGGALGHELGLDRGLQWTEHFTIWPDTFSLHWRPSPPLSYTEALKRQQRRMHGPARRAHLHLHVFARAAVFAVISAARSHADVAESEASAVYYGRRSPHHVAPAAAPYGGAYSGGPGSSVGQSQPASFAAAICSVIGRGGRGRGGGRGQGGGDDGQPRLDAAVLAALVASPSYSSCFVDRATTPTLLATWLADVQRAANHGDHAPLALAPLLVVLLALEDFFGGFAPNVPSLSTTGLAHMAKACGSLPFGRGKGGNEGSTMAAAAHVLSPLPPPDQELLLLMAAMMRHVARASGGRGCEDAMVEVGRWCVRLLLGRALAAEAAAEATVLSFLWWLLRNDAAYAAATLVRTQRLAQCNNYTLGNAIPKGPPAVAVQGLQVQAGMAAVDEQPGHATVCVTITRLPLVRSPKVKPLLPPVGRYRSEPPPLLAPPWSRVALLESLPPTVMMGQRSLSLHDKVYDVWI